MTEKNRTGDVYFCVTSSRLFLVLSKSLHLLDRFPALFYTRESPFHCQHSTMFAATVPTLIKVSENICWQWRWWDTKVKILSMYCFNLKWTKTKLVKWKYSGVEVQSLSLSLHRYIHSHSLSLCFFGFLQLFTPRLMFLFPSTSHPCLTPTSNPTSDFAEVKLFLELGWWLEDVKFILCHRFWGRKQAVSLFAP